MNDEMLAEVSERLAMCARKVYMFEKNGTPLENFFNLD